MPERGILTRPAAELAALVRAGEVAARELVEAALARIEERADLNAFTYVDAEGALAAADAIAAGDERPLAGVPIAVKDILSPVAGWPYEMGSAALAGLVAPVDGAATRRLREAGAVIVGKTALPEIGIVPVTEPRTHGPVLNPWDAERTPGGSSGGSAAAVAGGVLPLAHGTDGGGSIRIPAACCGLVGLKPSRGRISSGPFLGESMLAVNGVLSRTVLDTAVALDAMAGYEPGDAAWAPPPAVSFTEAAGSDPGRLRIGLVLDPPLPVPVDAVNEAAVRDTGELLERLGHDVEEAQAPWGEASVFEAFLALWSVTLSSALKLGTLAAGRELSEDRVEPLTWWLAQQAESISALDLSLAIVQLQAIARGVVAWQHASYDVLVTPVTAQRPVKVGEIDTCGPDPAATFAAAGAFAPFTALANLTGQPAISLPLFHGGDGLPTGVHLVGPPAGEETLLSLGAQLEAAHPWAGRFAPGA